MGVLPSLLFGVLADCYKVWKLTLVIHLLILASLVVFVVSVPAGDHVYTEQSPEPLGMTIGFIASNVAASSIFTLN